MDKDLIYKYSINTFYRYIQELAQEIEFNLNNNKDLKKFITIKPTDYTKITKDIIEINNLIQVKEDINIINELTDIELETIEKIKELFYNLDEARNDKDTT